MDEMKELAVCCAYTPTASLVIRRPIAGPEPLNYRILQAQLYSREIKTSRSIRQ